MKRVIVICCVLMCFGGVQLVQAQSLKDILNSSKVKDVVNLVTGNVIKFSDLQGTWNYVEPACKMTRGFVERGEWFVSDFGVGEKNGEYLHEVGDCAGEFQLHV